MRIGNICISCAFMNDDLPRTHSWVPVYLYSRVTVTLIAVGLLQDVPAISLHFTLSPVCSRCAHSPACLMSAEDLWANPTLGVWNATTALHYDNKGDDIKVKQVGLICWREIKDSILKDIRLEFCFGDFFFFSTNWQEEGDKVLVSTLLTVREYATLIIKSQKSTFMGDYDTL